MTLHACDYCASEYTSPLAAALCCDAISNDLGDHEPGSAALAGAHVAPMCA